MEPISALLASIGQMFGMSGAAGAAGGAAGGTGLTAAVAPGAGTTLGVTAPSGAALAGSGSVGLNAAPSAMFGGQSGLLGMLGGAKDAVLGAGAIQGLKTILPKSSEEAMAAIKDKSGIGSLEKTYTTITDPKLDFRGKFDVLAPEAYKRSMENQAMFSQLQQQGQPMQMPSYTRPSMPYQGGGIEEILQRQRGLLR